MRQIMANPHFVQIVSCVGRVWHSPSWRSRHPDIDLGAYLDGLHQLLQHEVFTQTSPGQTTPVSLLALLDTLQTTDPRLSTSVEDHAWLLATMRSRRARTVMLVLLTSIYSEPTYYTPEQLAALGAGSIEEWQEQGSSVPGAFQAGGRWFFPSISLRAIGVPVDRYPQRRMVDPYAKERLEPGSS
jgi:hypothetical protein